MTERVIEMHRILKETGSIYFHCDPTASHYVKIMLDEIFGRNNFRNEIIWAYKGASEAKKTLPKKHDIILFYAKSDNTVFNYDAIRVPYKENQEKSAVWDGIEHKKNPLGTKCLDWWGDIPSFMTASQSKERTGYPTQKPLALLERIIKASCPSGGVVLDPFCGCATTCVAAENLNRKWIGIDIAEQSVDLVMERLKDAEGHLFTKFINLSKPPKRTDIVEELITNETKNSIKERLFKQQNGHCNGCNIQLEIRLFEIDHIIPKARGGGDYFENYQLLCGHCNKSKGDKPMDYLRIKIEERKKLMKNKIKFGE
jgi:site-specific DNA-methyltransferase (adenine-specific)